MPVCGPSSWVHDRPELMGGQFGLRGGAGGLVDAALLVLETDQIHPARSRGSGKRGVPAQNSQENPGSPYLGDKKHSEIEKRQKGAV